MPRNNEVNKPIDTQKSDPKKGNENLTLAINTALAVKNLWWVTRMPASHIEQSSTTRENLVPAGLALAVAIGLARVFVDPNNLHTFNVLDAIEGRLWNGLLTIIVITLCILLLGFLLSYIPGSTRKTDFDKLVTFSISSLGIGLIIFFCYNFVVHQSGYVDGSNAVDLLRNIILPGLDSRSLNAFEMIVTILIVSLSAFSLIYIKTFVSMRGKISRKYWSRGDYAMLVVLFFINCILLYVSLYFEINV